MPYLLQLTWSIYSICTSFIFIFIEIQDFVDVLYNLISFNLSLFFFLSYTREAYLDLVENIREIIPGRLSL